MQDHAADRVPAVVDRLKHLITQELDVRLSVTEIDGGTSLFEGGIGLDSFAIVELITLIEKNFEFEFPEADLRPEVFADLRTLATVVAARAQGGAGGG